MGRARAVATVSLALLLAATTTGCAAAEAAELPAAPPARATFLPASVPQGSLVLGLAEAGATVEYAGRTLRVSADGRFVFGVGRDATGPLSV
ncbi:MAG: M23 family peptidase, partial [Lysobacter sp.]|nr:M23 family peptidase [Lysobacter sp.]